MAFYTSLSSIVKTIGSVFFGYIGDKHRLHTYFGMACPLILTLAYLFSLVIHPTIPFILFGLGGALTQVALWACLALAVDAKKIVR